MMKITKTIIMTLFSLLLAQTSWALVFPKPLPKVDVIGAIKFVKVKAGDDLYSLAHKYDVGFYEMVESNPGVDPDRPKRNTIVFVPSRYVLPNVPHKGIIINIAEMRLYYFPKHQNHVYTFPIGVGEMNWSTPLGKLRIIQKIKNPSWHVPKSIYEFRKKHGDPVPRVVKPGPKNPLGAFAMRLSNPSYLIHGTDEPAGVGQRSSAGCIRMYPKDIKKLFSMVPVGTSVNIVNQPYKLGRENDKLVLEAHQPFKEDKPKYPSDGGFVLTMLKSFATDKFVEWNLPLAKQAALAQTGLPAVIGDFTD
ncbi:MAG: L,D-transpeptidase family protein [Coxiellaceae bacterium]|nr:L,D-transpeptidase family protein [Coxiellaceae bacterium]